MPIAAAQANGSIQSSDFPGSFAALQHFQLTSKELQALGRQGYLQQDKRGEPPEGYWRLRFRFEGRTRSVYVGTDPTLIEGVKADLAALRSAARLTQESQKLLKEAADGYGRPSSDSLACWANSGCIFGVFYAIGATRRN